MVADREAGRHRLFSTVLFRTVIVQFRMTTVRKPYEFCVFRRAEYWSVYYKILRQIQQRHTFRNGNTSPVLRKKFPWVLQS